MSGLFNLGLCIQKGMPKERLGGGFPRPLKRGQGRGEGTGGEFGRRRKGNRYLTRKKKKKGERKSVKKGKGLEEGV